MPMRVTLQDVFVSIDAAMQRPESTVGDGTTWTARDCGRQARQALEAHSTRQAIPFLKLATESEVMTGGGTSFADAWALFLIWMDQVVELSSCPECGAELGRACTMNNHVGAKIAREWVHPLRIQEAPEVLA